MNAQYLKESVGKYLCQALCEVSTRRPERPIEFLAYYLISLYEKDLELQREEKENLKNGEKSTKDLVAPVISQMFRERLSISMSRDRAISITPKSSATSAAPDADGAEDILMKMVKMVAGDEGEVSPDASKTEVEKFIHTEADELIQTEADELIQTEVHDPSVRKLSSMNDPVTETESREFGTTDPFLIRRPSNVFDVNASPIGNQ